MMGSRAYLPTPVPSSDHDLPSSPPGKHMTQRVDLAPPPPSSPPRLGASSPAPMATDAVSGVSPEKRAAPVRRPSTAASGTPRTATVPPPELGIKPLPNDKYDALFGSYTHALVVGRAMHAQVAPEACVSAPLLGSQPAVRADLPQTAKHASRTHAVIRWVPFTSPVPVAGGTAAPGTFIVRVLGQNGLIVNGKRRRPGQTLRLEPGKSTLDFFGFPFRFLVAEEPAAPAPQPRKAVRSAVSPVKPAPRVAASRPLSARVPAAPSSPPRPAAEAQAAPSSPPPPAPSSPLSEADRSSDVSPPASPSQRDARTQPLAERRDAGNAKRTSTASPAPSKRADTSSPTPAKSPSEDTELVQRLVARLAPTYDLEGLLAGAIVFHRTATIAASEAVRSVLSSNPGMMRGEAGARMAAYSPSKRRLDSEASPAPVHGEVIAGWSQEKDAARWSALVRRAWHDRLEEVLQNSPMFGAIQRPGKDTNGKPLECWYHYDKENDPDRERAANLGAFVKPMRNAVRSQKPIFWKKSEYGKPTSQGGPADAMAEEKLPYMPRSQSDEEPGRKRRAPPAGGSAKRR